MLQSPLVVWRSRANWQGGILTPLSPLSHAPACPGTPEEGESTSDRNYHCPQGPTQLEIISSTKLMAGEDPTSSPGLSPLPM